MVKGLIKKIPKQVTKGLKKPLKQIPKQVTKNLNKPFKQIGKAFKQLGKMLNILKKPIMNIIKKIVGGFTFIFFYIKCGLKMIKNFYKCIIFYVLDILKYIFIYLPAMTIVYIIKQGSHWNRVVKPQLDKHLKWSNDTLNDCYRCKNKKGNNKKLMDQIQALFDRDNLDVEPGFNFLFFLLVALGGGGITFSIWHNFVRSK